MKTSDELKFKDLLQKQRTIKEEERAIKEEIKEVLDRIVFTRTIALHKIPKTEEELSKTIKEFLSLNVRQNVHQYPWLDLGIIEDTSNANDSYNVVHIFAREKDILCNLKEIAEKIIIGRKCKVGDIGINFSYLGRFSLKDFI